MSTLSAILLPLALISFFCHMFCLAQYHALTNSIARSRVTAGWWLENFIGIAVETAFVLSLTGIK